MHALTRKVKATPVANGSEKDDNAIPPARYTSWGRLFEIVAVAFATGCLFAFSLGIEGPLLPLIIIVLLLLGSVGAYKRAIHYAISARLRQQELDDAEEAKVVDEAERRAKLTYQVTKARIKTLQAAGVPADVTDALSCFIEDPPLTDEEFIKRLAVDPRTDLGLERSNEFRDQILKYTRVDAGVKKPPVEAEARLPSPVG